MCSLRSRIFVLLVIVVVVTTVGACSTAHVIRVNRVLVRDIAVQDLTGSGVASLLDWVRARPDVVERAGLVQFNIDVGGVEDEVTPDLSTRDKIRDKIRTYSLIMPWESRPRPEIRVEPDGVGVIPCPERATQPYQLAKKKGIASLHELTIEIDGKGVDLARTAVLHWELRSLVLLPVGRHEIRVVREGKSAVETFNIPARQTRIRARDIMTKNISIEIFFDVAFRDRIITVFDLSDRPYNDSPFSLLLPPCDVNFLPEMKTKAEKDVRVRVAKAEHEGMD